MADLKEKLVELLVQGRDGCSKIFCKDCMYYALIGKCKENMVADHLIANGVTIQPDSMLATLGKAEGGRRMTVTCKLGEKGCWNDGKCRATSNCECKVVTNADRIRAMSDEDLATFLLGIAYARNTPWCEPFKRTFCDNCPSVTGTVEETGKTMEFNECDFADGVCPHGSDVVWWLQQPAEVDNAENC